MSHRDTSGITVDWDTHEVACIEIIRLFYPDKRSSIFFLGGW